MLFLNCIEEISKDFQKYIMGFCCAEKFLRYNLHEHIERPKKIIWCTSKIGYGNKIAFSYLKCKIAGNVDFRKYLLLMNRCFKKHNDKIYRVINK